MKQRIESIANGITREAISEQTHLFYDPSTGAVSVSFQYRDSLFQDDKFLAAAGDWSTVQTSLEAIASRTFAAGLVDPVTGAALSQISPAGVTLYIKSVFGPLYDEAFAAFTAAQAASAVPDQPAAPNPSDATPVVD